MKSIQTIAILVLAVLLPGLASTFGVSVRLLGIQPEVLAPLLVCAGLLCGLPTIVATAVAGGVSVDALSMNPLGASVLPLLMVGLLIHGARDVLLIDSRHAQAMLGAGAGAFVPLATWVIAHFGAATPLGGSRLLAAMLLGAASGAILAPVYFFLLRGAQELFGYKPWPSVGFRPDREIVRPRR